MEKKMISSNVVDVDALKLVELWEKREGLSLPSLYRKTAIEFGEIQLNNNYLNIEGSEWEGMTEILGISNLMELNAFCAKNSIDWQTSDESSRYVFSFDGHIAYCLEYDGKEVEPKVVIRDFENEGGVVYSYINYQKFFALIEFDDVVETALDDISEDSVKHFVEVPKEANFKGIKKNETLDLLLNQFNGKTEFSGVVASYLERFCDQPVRIEPKVKYSFEQIQEVMVKKMTLSQMLTIVKRLSNKKIKAIEKHFKFLEDNGVSVEMEKTDKDLIEKGILVPHNTFFFG